MHPVSAACLWQGVGGAGNTRFPYGEGAHGPWREEAKCRHVLQNGSHVGSAWFRWMSSLSPTVLHCLAL